MLAGTYGLCCALYLLLHVTVGDDWAFVRLLDNGANLLLLGCVPALLVALGASRYRWVYVGYTLPGALAWVLWQGVLFLPNVPSQVNGLELEVVSFNTAEAIVRLDEWQETFPTADVIGFQELALFRQDRDDERLKIREDTRAIFSPHPVVPGSTRAVMAPDKGEETAVAVRAVLEVEGQPIAVYSFHPKRPDISLRPLAYLDAERRQAVDALLAAIAEEVHPVLVLCDCNMSDRTGDYRRMTQHLQDAWRSAGWGLGLTAPGRGARIAGTGFFTPLVRVDYVWHSHHFETRAAQVLDVSGSDHLPVQATLVLRPN